MAPLKYEEALKDKLEKRTLQPSKNAWDTLADRLDNEQKPNRKPVYLWLGIAASVVGVLFVVMQFSNSPKQEEIKIATTPEVNASETVIVKTVEESSKQLEVTETPTQVLPNVIKKSEEEDKLKTTSGSETVIATTIKSKESDIEEKTKANIPLTFEEQKVQDVVAQVKVLNETQEVTEDDIDALLKQAKQEIRYKKLVNETTGVVDANLLLQDVEAELDQSFRMRVFEAIKDSYITVKTAVAQRNE